MAEAGDGKRRAKNHTQANDRGRCFLNKLNAPTMAAKSEESPHQNMGLGQGVGEGKL
jgi:hypothetical protein